MLIGEGNVFHHMQYIQCDVTMGSITILATAVIAWFPLRLTAFQWLACYLRLIEILLNIMVNGILIFGTMFLHYLPSLSSGEMI